MRKLRLLQLKRAKRKKSSKGVRVKSVTNEIRYEQVIANYNGCCFLGDFHLGYGKSKSRRSHNSYHVCWYYNFDYINNQKDSLEDNIKIM